MFYAGYADGDASAVRTLQAVATTKLPFESIRRRVVLKTHTGSAVIPTADDGISSCPTLQKPFSSCHRVCGHGEATDEGQPITEARQRHPVAHAMPHGVSRHVSLASLWKTYVSLGLLKVAQSPTSRMLRAPFQAAIVVRIFCYMSAKAQHSSSRLAAGDQFLEGPLVMAIQGCKPRSQIPNIQAPGLREMRNYDSIACMRRLFRNGQPYHA